MTGHPDWQGYADWLGTPLISDADRNIGVGPHSYGGFEVTHYASLLVAGYATLSQARLTITWQPASILSGGGVLQTIICAQNKQAVAIVPNLAGRIVDISAAGGTAATVLDLLVAPTNMQPGTLAQADNAFPYNALGAALGSGATIEDSWQFYAGPAMLHFKSITATYQLRVWARDEINHVATLLDVPVAAGGVVDQFLYVPPWLNRVRITNTDVINGTYDITVTRAFPNVAR